MITINSAPDGLFGVCDCVAYEAVLDTPVSLGTVFLVRIYEYVDGTNDIAITSFFKEGKAFGDTDQVVNFDISRILYDYMGTFAPSQPQYGQITPLVDSPAVKRFYVKIYAYDKTTNTSSDETVATPFAYWRGFRVREDNLLTGVANERIVSQDSQTVLSYLAYNPEENVRELWVIVDTFFEDGSANIQQTLHVASYAYNAIITVPITPNLIGNEVRRMEVVFLEKEGLTVVNQSKVFVFRVMQKCQDNFVFLNVYGGWENFTSQLVFEKSVSIQNEQYKNIAGCGITNRTNTTYFADSKETYTCKTRAVQPFETDSIRTLLESYNVLYQKEGQFVPINFQSPDSYNIHMRKLAILTLVFVLSVACDRRVQPVEPEILPANVNLDTLLMSDNDFLALWAIPISNNEEVFFRVYNQTNPTQYPPQTLQTQQPRESLYIRDTEFQPNYNFFASPFGQIGDVVRVEYQRKDLITGKYSAVLHKNLVLTQFYYPPLPANFGIVSIFDLGGNTYEFEFAWDSNLGIGGSGLDRLYINGQNLSNGITFSNNSGNCYLADRGELTKTTVMESANGCTPTGAGNLLISSGDTLRLEYWVENPSTQYRSQKKTLTYIVP